jgi:leucine-rich repeat kinase 2
VTVFPKVFISYCWVNSHDAVKKGTREVKGALGFYDPRQLKQYIEDKGLAVWMDIEKVAQVIPT